MKTVHERIEKKILIEVARCIQRLALVIYVKAEILWTYHIVQSSRQAISIKLSRHPDQP